METEMIIQAIKLTIVIVIITLYQSPVMMHRNQQKNPTDNTAAPVLIQKLVIKWKN